jgi:plastocyanin
MTTDTQEPEASTAEEAAVAVPPAGTAALPAATEPEPNPHPIVERYVVPLLIPVTVIAALIFYVLNVSRVFLATQGAGAVAAAVVMTLAILAGGAALSNAPRLRTSSITLVVVGVFVVIGMAGWLTVGAASPHDEVEVVFEPVVQKATIETGNFFFRNLDPTAVPVGVTELDITNTEGAHTFVIQDPGVQIEGGKGNMDAPGDFAVRINFTEAGTFTFFCDIPGHRASGMEGEITVDAALPAEPLEDTGDGSTEPSAADAAS